MCFADYKEQEWTELLALFFAPGPVGWNRRSWNVQAQPGHKLPEPIIPKWFGFNSMASWSTAAANGRSRSRVWLTFRVTAGLLGRFRRCLG